MQIRQDCVRQDDLLFSRKSYSTTEYCMLTVVAEVELGIALLTAETFTPNVNSLLMRRPLLLLWPRLRILREHDL